MNPAMAAKLSADFDCGCYARVTYSPIQLTLWQCTAGENCPGWRLIMAELERCLCQLRIHVLGRSL